MNGDFVDDFVSDFVESFVCDFVESFVFDFVVEDEDYIHISVSLHLALNHHLVFSMYFGIN